VPKSSGSGRFPYGERRSASHKFLPPDPKAQEPYRLTPGLALRVGVLGVVALIVFGTLFFRLWSVQILSGAQYLAAAQDNQLRTIRVEAQRGPILDRNGRIIVDTTAGLAVKLWVGDLPRQGRFREIQRLAAVLDVPVLELARDVDAHRGQLTDPITVKTAVHDDQFRYLLEHQADFPGASIVKTYLRHSPYQSLAAQVLGYVGEISPAQLMRLAGQRDGGQPRYRAGDKIGQVGVEAAKDEVLRGKPGLAQIRVDSLGRPRSALQPSREARKGVAIQLTIDIRLQRAAERALRDGIALAHANGQWAANGGAIVALDPSTGAVLALASNPTYKPSLFTGRVDPEKVAPLLNEAAAKAKNYPGVDKATLGLYPPGSVWKPVTALAAMQEHLLSAYESIQCTPQATYGKDNFVFKNWDGSVNQPMTLTEALAQSCDTYFYAVGNRFYERGPATGWSRLQDWARRLGFGAPTGLDIGTEASGLLPTPKWRKQHFRSSWDKAWNPGDSILLAIGQKDLTVTPLQMARFYALLANGGKLVTPYVIAAADQLGAKGEPPIALQQFAPVPPQSAGVDPAAVDVIGQGLLAATHGAKGTSAGVFGSFPVPIAGKTGTAERVTQLPGYPVGHKEDQSWWCGWGPYGQTQYAGRKPIVVCALIENGGHGSTAAAPAALEVFEQWFGVKPQAQTQLVKTD
jgi:penicillin-binding protein 2